MQSFSLKDFKARRLHGGDGDTALSSTGSESKFSQLVQRLRRQGKFNPRDLEQDLALTHDTEVVPGYLDWQTDDSGHTDPDRPVTPKELASPRPTFRGRRVSAPSTLNLAGPNWGLIHSRSLPWVAEGLHIRPPPVLLRETPLVLVPLQEQPVALRRRPGKEPPLVPRRRPVPSRIPSQPPQMSQNITLLGVGLNEGQANQDVELDRLDVSKVDFDTTKCAAAEIQEVRNTLFPDGAEPWGFITANRRGWWQIFQRAHGRAGFWTPTGLPVQPNVDPRILCPDIHEYFIRQCDLEHLSGVPITDNDYKFVLLAMDEGKKLIVAETAARLGKDLNGNPDPQSQAVIKDSGSPALSHSRSILKPPSLHGHDNGTPSSSASPQEVSFHLQARHPNSQQNQPGDIIVRHFVPACSPKPQGATVNQTGDATNQVAAHATSPELAVIDQHFHPSDTFQGPPQFRRDHNRLPLRTPPPSPTHLASITPELEVNRETFETSQHQNNQSKMSAGHRARHELIELGSMDPHQQRPERYDFTLHSTRSNMSLSAKRVAHFESFPPPLGHSQSVAVLTHSSPTQYPRQTGSSSHSSGSHASHTAYRLSGEGPSANRLEPKKRVKVQEIEELEISDTSSTEDLFNGFPGRLPGGAAKRSRPAVRALEPPRTSKVRAEKFFGPPAVAAPSVYRNSQTSQKSEDKPAPGPEKKLTAIRRFTDVANKVFGRDSKTQSNDVTRCNSDKDKRSPSPGKKGYKYTQRLRSGSVDAPLAESDDEEANLPKISVNPGEQMWLICRVEFILNLTANDFLMLQKRNNRMDPDSVMRIAKQWHKMNRPQPIEFMYDMQTQLDLINANIQGFVFFGPHKDSYMGKQSFVTSWRGIIRELNHRVFCLPDHALKKMMVDAFRVLEMLGGENEAFIEFGDMQRLICELAEKAARTMARIKAKEVLVAEHGRTTKQKSPLLVSGRGIIDDHEYFYDDGVYKGPKPDDVTLELHELERKRKEERQKQRAREQMSLREQKYRDQRYREQLKQPQIEEEEELYQ